MVCQKFLSAGSETFLLRGVEHEQASRVAAAVVHRTLHVSNQLRHLSRQWIEVEISLEFWVGPCCKSWYALGPVKPCRPIRVRALNRRHLTMNLVACRARTRMVGLLVAAL